MPDADAGPDAEFDRIWLEELLKCGLVWLERQIDPPTFVAYQRYVLGQEPVAEVCSDLGLSPQQLYKIKWRLTQMLRDWTRATCEAMGRGIKQHFREQVRAALERQYVSEFPDRRKRTPEEIEVELAAYDERAGVAQGVDVARRVLDEYVLKRAAEALAMQFENQPLVQAQIRTSLGTRRWAFIPRPSRSTAKRWPWSASCWATSIRTWRPA